LTKSRKTTLASIIAGFQPATTGSTVVTGTDQGVKLSELVLYVPQAPYILNQSVRDNLTLGRKFPDERLNAILEEVGLADTINKLLSKLDTLVGGNDAVLSGGERQRLALARALLVEAPIVILDESTSNVDEQTAIQIDKLFLDDPQKTVLYISHESNNDYYQGKFDSVIDLG
jgi:ABC-type transport system involved in cytochrome bd biosynthesis fused ATPase/permease subunit